MEDEMHATMKALENNIRRILMRDYTTVRKAFLDLDQNRDGLIEPTDFIKRFGHMFEIKYEYLERLMSKNALNEETRSQGVLNYSDFSRWLGPSIHLAEGFLFRHDSRKNPHYEKWLVESEKLKGADKQAAAQSLWTEDTVLN